MSNIIQFNKVTKTYSNFKLDNISFDVPKGYITGFIGPNGSGKTTSIKLMLSMIFKDSGDIALNGNNIENDAYLSNIGIVMDDSYLMKDWIVKDLSKVLNPFYKKWDDALFQSYLKRFNIDPTYKVSELSKGMTIKLMLSVALSHDADLLILDEPTSGLDPSSREEICDILQDYVQDETKSVLFSTHITADLEAIADTIIFILNGNIVYKGLKDDLLYKYKIIKGGLDDLQYIDSQKLIGLKKNNTHFEALVSKDFHITLDNIIEETCSLEQIILFFNREAQHENTH